MASSAPPGRFASFSTETFGNLAGGPAASAIDGTCFAATTFGKSGGTFKV